MKSGASCLGLERDALDAAQFLDCTGALRVERLEIHLHDFIAGALTHVLDRDRGLNAAVRRHRKLWSSLRPMYSNFV